MMAPEVHSRLFKEAGWTLIHDAFSKTLAEKVAAKALEVFPEAAIYREGKASGGGCSKYWVLDGGTVLSLFPGVFDWYSDQLPLLSRIVEREVICSPYLRSAINVKIYQDEGNGQGWHYDTNPLSAVLFLTDSGGALVIRDLKGDAYEIEPRRGLLLLMQGREILHSVLESSQPRVSCILNYYYPDDCDRPEWIDRAIYENQDPPRLT